MSSRRQWRVGNTGPGKRKAERPARLIVFAPKSLTSTVMEKMAEGWVLHLDEYAVTQCWIDYAFTLLVASGRSTIEVRIEGEFIVRDGARVTTIGSEDREAPRFAPALAAWGRQVKGVTVRDHGVLEIRLDGDLELTVPPNDDYESWQIAGPDGFLVVCMPGGKLAIWSASAEHDLIVSVTFWLSRRGPVSLGYRACQSDGQAR